MSELVMYADERPKQAWIAGLGVSYTIIPSGAAPLLATAERRYRNDPRVGIDPENLRMKGISVSPLWRNRGSTAAFSLSLGTMLGADLSVKLPADLYVTFVGTMDGGFETILQRRIINSKLLGVGLGVSHRAEHHSFYVYRDYNDEYPSTYWFPNERLVTHAFGLRTNIMLFQRDQNSLYIRGVAFGGYSPTMESGVARFGMSLGAF